VGDRLETGQVVAGRYRLLRAIGEGGNGLVYLAEDLFRGAGRVALKTLLPGSISPAAAAEFKAEFAAMARLRHPNLVEVYDFGVLPDQQRHFLTMEYVEGPSLREIEAPLPWETLRTYAIQVGDALEFIHARGFVHRDIKPGNLLLAPADTPGGAQRVKVADFGLATRLDDPRRAVATGTLQYLAPERLAGGAADRRGDLYSLGAVLFHLATGRPPRNPVAPHASTPSPAEIREALPAALPADLGGVIVQLLDPVPGRRLPSAAAVRAALGSAGGDRADGLRATPSSLTGQAPLVGRASELARLGELLHPLRADAVDPKGTSIALLILRGEAGIGKSRLLREAKVLAQVEGIEVAEVRLDDGGGDGPWAPVVRLARDATPSDDGLASEEKLATRIVSCLEIASRRRPVLLCIEDLAAADGVALGVLRRLSVAPQSLRLLTLATLRDEDLAGSPAARALAPLLTRVRTEQMRLQRLSVAEVAALAAQMLGTETAPQALIDRLISETRGNPLWLGETLRSLAETGTIVRAPEGWRVDTPALARVVAPANALEAVGRRLSHLEEPVTRALVALAVCGRPATAQELGLALDETAAMVSAAMRTLTQRGLATEVPGPDGATALPRFGLGHPWFGRAALASGDRDRIRTLHARFAEALGGAAGFPPEEVGRHLLAAGDATRALPLLRLAAAEAERRQALGRAAEHYGEILGLLPPGQGEERAATELALARVHERVGASARAVEACTRALAALPPDADARRRAHLHHRISFNASIGGDYPTALEHAGRALEALAGTDDVAGEAEARKGLGVAWARQGDLDRAQLCYEESLLLFQRIGDERGVASVWNNLALLCLFRGDRAAAAGLFERALALRTHTGDEAGRIGPLINLAKLRTEEARFDEALGRLDECLAIAGKVGDRQNAGNAQMQRAETLRRGGAYEKALSALAAALRIHEELGDVAREIDCHDKLGDLLRRLGDIAAAAEHHRRALDLARRLEEPVQEGYALASLGLDRLGLGEPGAQADLEEALAIGEARSSRFVVARALRGLALAEAMRGSWEAMAHRADHLLLLAAEKPELEEERAWGLRLLGEAQVGRGELEAGRRALHGAAATAARERIPELEREALLLLADSYHRGGRPGDALEARQRAQQILEVMAMKIDDDGLRTTFVSGAVRAAAPSPERAVALTGAVTPPPSTGRSRGLGAIYDISQAINSLRDPDELLETVMDTAIDKLQAERGLIILFDGPGGEMRARVARNLDHETIDDAIAYSRHVVRAAAEGRTVLSLDAAHDERFRDYRSVHLNGIRSLLVAPLRLAGEVIGTVYLDSRRPGDPFQEEDVQFLEVFANMAALALHNAREFDRLEQENRMLRDEIRGRSAYGNIVGKSARMQSVFDLVSRVADSTLSVLIQGESGTGKELVARAIHNSGPRREGRFCSENCSALAETLLESELFGHVRGAFTGADSNRQGLFEVASGGTLFLDEIGDMSVAMQGKLLRAVQEGEIRPVGGKRTLKVDVRILSATNKDLEQLMREGRFREDLFYRLGVVKIALPSLRERKEDIPLLVDHFLHKVAVASRRPEKRMDRDALQLVLRYHWPGNVRELENEVHKLAVFSEGEVITLDDLYRHQDLFNRLTDLGAESPLESIDEVERKQILRALQETGGHRGRAAQILGISRATIFRKIKQYGISS